MNPSTLSARHVACVCDPDTWFATHLTVPRSGFIVRHPDGRCEQYHMMTCSQCGGTWHRCGRRWQRRTVPHPGGPT